MKISTLWIGFGLCGVTVGAIVWAQNSRPVVTENRVTGTPQVVAQASKPSGVSAAPVSATAPRSLLFYNSAQISGSMFARPTPPAPEPPAPTPPAPRPQPPIMPPPPDPLENYIYTGTVTIDNQRLALLEDRRTKVGTYVKIGDRFLGSATVIQVESGQVMLSMGGTTRALPRSTVINLTPLDKSAAFLGNGQNGPGGSGGAPVPGGPMSGGAMPAAAQAMMQAQAMQVEADTMRAVMANKMQMDGGATTLEFKLAAPK